MTKFLVRSEYCDLRSERAHLQTRLSAAAKAIGDAAELGDLSENAEFEMAKAERDSIIERIRRIDSHISSAQVVDDSELDPMVILMGKQIRLLNIVTQEITTYVVRVFPIGLNHMSTSSPMGKALHGKKLGDCVEGFEVVGICAWQE